MVFQWKLKMSVPVEDAVAELDRINQKYGEIDPATIVEESRPEDAVLHKLFDWDDASAAEKYRLTQARFIIRNIQHTEETGNGNVVVRTYHNTDHGYKPTQVIMQDAYMREILLRTALKELEEFRAKYHHLAALAVVFDAMDKIEKTA